MDTVREAGLLRVTGTFCFYYVLFSSLLPLFSPILSLVFVKRSSPSSDPLSSFALNFFPSFFLPVASTQLRRVPASLMHISLLLPSLSSLIKYISGCASRSRTHSCGVASEISTLYCPGCTFPQTYRCSAVYIFQQILLFQALLRRPNSIAWCPHVRAPSQISQESEFHSSAKISSTSHAPVQYFTWQSRLPSRS